MRNNAYWLLVVLAFVLIAKGADEDERAPLRVIKAAYEEACKTGDPQKLAPHLSTNVTGVMVTGEEVIGLEGIKNYWAKIQSLMGPGSIYETAITVDNSEFFGDTSLSRGTTADLVRLATGRELKFNTRWSAVCRKENGAWKIHRMQASMDPVENVFISARITGAKFTYGIGGVVSGLALGLVFFRRRRTRS
jgi:ketosteroid isomerase-like protein